MNDVDADIRVVFSIHAYRGEKKCDSELLPPDYGLNGPDIIIPLLTKDCLKIVYNSLTTIGEVYDKIKEHLVSGMPYNILPGYFAFIADDTEYSMDDRNSNFKFLLNKWLDGDNTGIVTVVVWVNCSAGCAAVDEGLRYYIHSKESGQHNEPHVHVCSTAGEEVSIAILTGKVLAGKMKTKNIRKAQSFINKNMTMFVHFWNAHSDGLSIDINQKIGLTLQ